MQYVLLDSTGNLIDSFDNEADARAAQHRIVENEPDAAEHVALLAYGEDGMPVGEPVFVRSASAVR